MAKGDIVLRVEGKTTGAIQGESACEAYPNAIDVRAFSWGMSGPTALAGAGVSAKSSLNELRITKGVDRASTALASVMRTNEPIKKAILTVRKSSGGKPIDYLVITIERGRLTAFDLATEGDDSPELVEHLSFSFEKIEISYASQDTRGGKAAASVFTAAVN